MDSSTSQKLSHCANPVDSYSRLIGPPVDFRHWWDSKDHTFGGDATPLSVAGMSWEAAHQKYTPPILAEQSLREQATYWQDQALLARSTIIGLDAEIERLTSEKTKFKATVKKFIEDYLNIRWGSDGDCGATRLVNTLDCEVN